MTRNLEFLYQGLDTSSAAPERIGYFLRRIFLGVVWPLNNIRIDPHGRDSLDWRERTISKFYEKYLEIRDRE